MFGFQYFDDENKWIIAVSDTCMQEAFRCAVPIAGTAMRRLKLKICVGAFVYEDKVADKKPKCLFGTDNTDAAKRDIIMAVDSAIKDFDDNRLVYKSHISRMT